MTYPFAGTIQTKLTQDENGDPVIAWKEVNMSGDHNMYQKTTGIHEQQFFAEQTREIRPGFQIKGTVPEPYRSVMEEQLSSLESRIDYMNNALNTLEQRLAPVMRDNPSRAAEASLPCADSPIGRKLENFNSRMNSLQNQILHIIEMLEI